MKYVHFGLLLVVIVVTLQLTWYAVLMESYIRTPGVLEEADFLTFYSAGRVASQYGFGRAYDLGLETDAQAAVAGAATGTRYVLPPNHPPFLFPILALLSRLPYRAAYLGYGITLYVLMIACLPTLGSTLRQNGWQRQQVGLAMGGILLFEPLFMSVLKGQDSVLLLIGGLLWFSGLERKDDRLAGLGLSLTLIRPQIALVLAVPFLFHRRIVFGWFCAGAAALGIYSFLLVGWNGAVDYVHILSLSAGGQGYGMGEIEMFNLIGSLLRLAPRLNLAMVHAIGWGFYITTIVGLCVLWGRTKTIKNWQIALAVTFSLFAAPHLHYHDLALLFVEILGAGMAGVSVGKLTIPRAAALPMAVSVILLLSEFWNPLRFTVPNLIMVATPLASCWYETR